GARVGSRLPGASRPGGLRGGAAAGRTLPFLLGLLFFALCIPRSSRMDRTDPARRRELVRRSRRNGRPPAAGAAARSSAMAAWKNSIGGYVTDRQRAFAAPPSPPSPRFVLACCRAAHGRRRDPDSRAPRK
ncbi:unnamed protein product, partial [Prorocentrum cordatum]